MAKTLIIAGTYKHSGSWVEYNVSLYGQTDQHPTCIYIRDIEVKTQFGYTQLEEEARSAYASYFETDLYNIISLTKLIEIKS